MGALESGIPTTRKRACAQLQRRVFVYTLESATDPLPSEVRHD